MNAVTKTAIFRPQNYFCLLQTAFFQSTPVLERKRGFLPWNPKAKKNKRSKYFLWEHQENKLNVKKFLWDHQEKVHCAVEELRRKREEKSNVKNILWEQQEKEHHAVEKLKREREEAKKAKENLNNCRQDSETTRESPFGYEDKDFEAVFRSVFSVPPRGLYDSFYEEVDDRSWWYNPSWYSNFCMTSWISTRRHYNNEEEVVEEAYEEEEYLNDLYEDDELYEYEEDPEQYEDEDEEEESYSSSNYTNWWRSNYSSDPIEASHRETLGLSPWAPLNIEDVKHAYRTCALKWHPDHHDDSTKAEAEAKFKLCNVAYQYLIQNLQ